MKTIAFQKNFTDLEVYKACRALRKNIALLTKTYFPHTETLLLKNQIIRSSRSVTACIAEGFGRFYHNDNIRFCRMSRGSLSETLEHLITAFDERYISEEVLLQHKQQIDSCGRLLNGYINYLKKAQKTRNKEL